MSAGQVTIPRLIEFTLMDLDVLREFWRIRKNKKSRMTFSEDIKSICWKIGHSYRILAASKIP
jgi:hypothetical protein